MEAVARNRMEARPERPGGPASGGQAERIELLPSGPRELADPGLVLLTCANCGARLVDRGCKLICRCGYFLSCSDYL